MPLVWSAKGGEPFVEVRGGVGVVEHEGCVGEVHHGRAPGGVASEGVEVGGELLEDGFGLVERTGLGVNVGQGSLVGPNGGVGVGLSVGGGLGDELGELTHAAFVLADAHELDAVEGHRLLDGRFGAVAQGLSGELLGPDRVTVEQRLQRALVERPLRAGRGHSKSVTRRNRLGSARR